MKCVINIISLVFILVLSACGGENMSEKINFQNIDNKISIEEINNISSKKIYFGHQSVGFNILDGVEDLLKENQGAQLNIIKSRNASVFEKPVFAHSPIGENSDPELKLMDFKNAIDNGIGQHVDIAFMKFCYLDINKTTDIEKVFSIYKKTFETLKKENPDTVFAHVTVPLTLSEFTIKSLIKKILGKKDNNIMRKKFNDKLISEYAGKDPIFDLAKVESTYPDGNVSSFTENGESYYSLAPEYAADNGHLNELGRRIAAKEFIKFLSDI
ncbi:MAG: hypothetical protein OEY89_00095 [Gammaproteobacteria bacterium]|nr:hypothetical protein [Gammaproteobacteria bacterium]